MMPKMTIGKSLRSLAEGKTVKKWRDYIVGESFLGTGQIGVRDSRHKTIFYGNGTTKVYDLKADPLEMKDLSEASAGKAVMAEHNKHLREYAGTIELCERVPKDKAAAYETYLKWYEKLRQ